METKLYVDGIEIDNEYLLKLIETQFEKIVENQKDIKELMMRTLALKDLIGKVVDLLEKGNA